MFLFSKILDSLQQAPIYVWPILGYLLFVGIQNTRARTTYLITLWIMPLLLLGVKRKVFLSDDIWLFIGLTAISGIGSFYIHMRHELQAIPSKKALKAPGSYIPLIILITFFIVKYTFGYLKITEPHLAEQYIGIENITVAICAGYFIGRLVNYTYRYLKAAA